MRHAVVLAVLLSSSGVAAQDKPAPAPSKKGDVIAIYGCLRGSSLEATDVGAASEDVSPLTAGLTFRLTGDKALLKEMKEKHEKKLVEVRGVLKSNLEQPTGPEAKVGRMRITIGSPSTGSVSAADEARRAVPVVEVKSYQGNGTACVR
jgi:hypothetical protein